MCESSSSVVKSSNAAKSHGEVKLRREIGLLEAVSITVGCIIGSGIFISPKGVLAECGSVGMALTMWIICGFLSLTGAMCYAEMGTMIPGSGGTYLYLSEAFGQLPAFLYLYTTIVISAPCTLAILALTFANYMAQAFAPLDCANNIPDSALRLIAALTLVFLTFINCYDVRATLKTQNVFLITKLSSLVLLISFGLYHLFLGQTQNFEKPFENTITDPARLSIAFYSSFFSFNGFMVLNFMTEELKNPYVTLPRAIYISLPTVTLIYVMANVAYFTVLSSDEILRSAAIAVSFSEKLFGVVSWVMSLFVAISTCGSLTINILSYSRLIYAAAREKHCPTFLSHIQVHRLTPTPALIFLCFTSLLYLTISDVYVLINYSCYIHNLANLGVVAGLLIMRKTKPGLQRPLKVFLLYPIIYFTTSLFAVVLPIYSRPVEVGLAIVIALTGLPAYSWLVSSRPSFWLMRLNELVTIFNQKLFQALPED